MNENINLVEILKDAPKGTKLWSPICGICTLDKIDTISSAPIIVRANGGKLSFNSNGLYYNLVGAECLLFPSKEHRDWSTFKAPWKHKHFEPGQKVLVPYYDGDKHRWKLDIYSHWEEGNNLHFTIDETYLEDKNIIPYEGNEDKLGKPIDR